jgi:hypothetical protein
MLRSLLKATLISTGHRFVLKSSTLNCGRTTANLMQRLSRLPTAPDLGLLR